MAKQIYIDENGNEVLVSGTITNAGNLPLGSDFSDPTSTAGAIASKQDKAWTLLNSYSGSATADISGIFSTASEIKITARTYTTGQLGSSQMYTTIITPTEITAFMSGGFTELHFLQGMNNGQSNVIDFGVSNTAIRIATFILNGVDVQSSSNTGYKVYYR